MATPGPEVSFSPNNGDYSAGFGMSFSCAINEHIGAAKADAVRGRVHDVLSDEAMVARWASLSGLWPATVRRVRAIFAQGSSMKL